MRQYWQVHIYANTRQRELSAWLMPVLDTRMHRKAHITIVGRNNTVFVYQHEDKVNRAWLDSVLADYFTTRQLWQPERFLLLLNPLQRLVYVEL